MEPRSPVAHHWILALGLLLFAQPAAAADGSIRCRAVDSAGRRVDGTCTASGPATRSCTTAGGACTINAPPGNYTVTFRTRSGRSSTPRSARVLDGASVTVVLTADPGPVANFEHEGGEVLQTLPAATADAGADADAGTRADAGGSADAGTRSDAGTTTSGTGGTVTGGEAGAVVAADAEAGAPLGADGAQAATVVAQPAQPPDRSTGTTLALQGRTSDARGRAVDGTITVSKDGTAVARAATSGGRFQLYDLPRGTLTLTFRSTTGATTTATASYSGGALTLNLTIPAP